MNGKRYQRLLRALPVLLLTSCQADVLNPQGPVGVREASLIAITFIAMLIVVIPVIFMTLYFAWRYRANGGAAYDPKWARSVPVEITVWGVPLAIIVFLGVLDWRSTHLLDPYRPLGSPGKSLNVQVVAMDWKWLFIYPDQHIATVNTLEIPTGTQVNFYITSDTVMNVFFIPQLGTQIYAMSGMQTQVHLLAKNPGTYRGISANFSGEGFADMRFLTHAVSTQAFDTWVKKSQTAPAALDDAAFKALQKPSSHNAVAIYGSVNPDLFSNIIMEHAGQMRIASGKAQ